MSSPRLSTVLDSTEVCAELRRRGLPSSYDSLSRCIGALFGPGEIASQQRSPRTRGNTGYAFTGQQAELIYVAVEIVATRSMVLKNLPILRRFARSRGEDELQVFRDFLDLARAHSGQGDAQLLGRTA